MNISQDERERAIFRSRKNFQMDMASNFATAFDNMRIERDAEIVRNAIQMGMNTDDIVKLTGLSIEEVRKLSNVA